MKEFFELGERLEHPLSEKPRSALRDGVAVLAAQGIATLIALGVDVLLFRTLPLDERGVLSAALSLRNVLLYIADLGIAFATVRVASELVAQDRGYAAQAVFRRAFTTRLLMVVGVAFGCAVLAPLLAKFPLSASGRPALVWACAAGLFGMTLTAWGVDVSQSRRDFGKYFLNQVVEALMRAGAAAAVAFGVLSTRPLTAESILWAFAGGAFAAGCFSYLLHVREFKHPLSAEEKDLAKSRLKEFGAAAVLVALLQTIGGQAEIFLVQAQLPAEFTAYFDGARRLAMLLPLVGGAVVTVLLPRAAALSSREECAAYAKKVLKFCVPLSISCAGVLALAAEILIPLLWGERYLPSVPTMRWLCAAYGLSMVLQPLLLVFLPLKKNGVLVALHGLNLAIAVVAGVALIPSQGTLGAAYAALIARGVTLLLTFGGLAIMLRGSRGASAG